MDSSKIQEIIYPKITQTEKNSLLNKLRFINVMNKINIPIEACTCIDTSIENGKYKCTRRILNIVCESETFRDCEGTPICLEYLWDRSH